MDTTNHTDPVAPAAQAPDPDAPNHHAGYAGLSGPMGLVAAVSMSFGREADGELVCGLAGVTPDDRIVDIGCGPGTAARAGARRGAEVVGVDPGASMRFVARLRDPLRRVRLVAGTAEALPLGNGEASVAWTLASVHHWPDVDGAIAEVRRVLAPGGRFVAVERQVPPGAEGMASHGWRAPQAESFARRCRAAGFEVRTEVVTGARGPAYAVIAVRP